jgi:hypothetical protein
MVMHARRRAAVEAVLKEWHGPEPPQLRQPKIRPGTRSPSVPSLRPIPGFVWHVAHLLTQREAK